MHTQFPPHLSPSQLFCPVVHALTSPIPGDGNSRVVFTSLAGGRNKPEIKPRIPLRLPAPTANLGRRSPSLALLLVQQTRAEAQHLLSALASSRGRGAAGEGGARWVFTSLAGVLKIYYFHSSTAAALAFCREVIGLLSVRDTE